MAHALEGVTATLETSAGNMTLEFFPAKAPGHVENFVKLAEAYGHVGMLIERPQDVEPALREARSLKDRTVFMDFRTDPTENVFPMVQAGKGITEMLLGSEDL